MPRAILSVSDKTGIVDFARGMHEIGWQLLASGGTARTLREEGLPVTEVADYTGASEILGGRVKTLHPAIHAGLLARDSEADRSELENLGWDTIDLAAVNLYPFEETIAKPGVTFEEAIENIDIGGVALIRAAAKNHQRVILVCDPNDYTAMLMELKSGGVSEESRKCLAAKGFALTTRYDAAIANYLDRGDLAWSPKGSPMRLPLLITAYPVQELRYGENPHQSAMLYAWEAGAGPLGGKLMQGKALSYNNLLDLDVAWRAVVSFEKPTVVIVKHLSPCGIASAADLVSAFNLALASDPVSAFGGVIATNGPFDGATAEALGDLFVECIAAPGFNPETREKLAKRKNCRLLEMPNTGIDPCYEMRSITRGLLRQDIDFGDLPLAPPVNGGGTGREWGWECVTKREPTEAEWAALRFSWKACQHVKSNAIVLVQGEATVGIGGGQPNRVDCVHIAAERAGKKARGAVMASDAFFPFSDSVEAAVEVGVTAIVQPGGSIRDTESIAAADEAGIAMVFTGMRHFRH